MSIIEIKKLCKSYGNNEQKLEVLKYVDLTVNHGEFVAILGPSGSGKSTLLNLIGGLDDYDSGEIFIDGHNYKGLNEKERAEYRRKKIGFVFQAFNLIPTLNVTENILLPLVFDNKKMDTEYCDELLKLLDVYEKKSNMPNKLSGGEQQRVAIVRALINKPDIILADEPTGNLDTKSGQKVMELFVNCVKKYGNTLLMITHNEEIAMMADRIIKVQDGLIYD